jgi:CRP-like cAMP-binding protein
VSRGAIALDAVENSPSSTVVAGPGALIGQAALFTTIERPATATAIEPSGVLRIPPALMRRVLEEFPGAAVAIQDTLTNELAGLTEGLERVRQRLVAIDRGE